MKLVEILARELKEWPAGVACMAQNESMSVVRLNKLDVLHKDGAWVGSDGNSIVGFRDAHEKATDYKTAIVTRADWEAERARIAKPASKANKDGWIRHRGGKCPVEAGVLVDVRYRNGQVNEHVKALISIDAGGSIRELKAVAWDHIDSDLDIMRYRIHKPAEQPVIVGKIELEVTANTEGVREVIEEMQAKTGQIEGPLQWRDRIHEIDRTIEALEEERVSLIQRLEAEGLQLLQAKACGSVQPVEDMSDWRNWKIGDKIECLGHCPGQFTQGALYKVRALHQHSVSVDLDDNGSDTNGWGYSNFKWHSRPQS